MNINGELPPVELISIHVGDGSVLQLNAQQCWDFTEMLRWRHFKSRIPSDSVVVKKVHKNGTHYNVSVTKWLDFWISLEVGYWEPETFKIFDQFINNETYFLDIGAWIGPTALYACQLAKHTFAFEPDPVAYEELANNLKTNQRAPWHNKLTIINKAVSSSSGKLAIGSRSEAGDSMSSALFSDTETLWNVDAVSLEEFLNQHRLDRKQLFLKMDIEGGEYELLPKIRQVFPQHNAILYLSVHPEILLMHLKTKYPKTTWGRLRKRIDFFHVHLKLVYSLPFKYIYFDNGRRMNRYIQVVVAALYGVFPESIVALNSKWKKDDLEFL